MKPRVLEFETKQRIRYLLRARHGGWIKRAEIVEQLGIPDNAFRAAVADMISTGDPIATSFHRGYSWAEDAATLEAAAEELETKARALHVRAAHLRRSANAIRFPYPTGPQELPLDFRANAG